MREYRRFVYKDAAFRISTPEFDVATASIVSQRDALDGYTRLHHEFLTALEPVDLVPGAPAIALAMESASRATGVGPMAAVAGAMAQFAAEAAASAGADEAIVENGGDLFLISRTPVTVALAAGEPLRASSQLAFRVDAQHMPVAICSSSSKMGHSLSFGECDLATVVAENGALADAAATLACNLVRLASDIQSVLEHVGLIDGVQGVLLVKDDSIGMIGRLPELVRNQDPGTAAKTTRLRPIE